MTSIFFSPVLAQDHVELGLLLDRSRSRGGRPGSGNRHGSRRRYAPFLLQQLGQLGRFEDGEVRQLIYDFA